MKRLILLALCGLLLLSLAACTREQAPVPADHVISHRGASGEEPEHSWSAYDLAVAYGSKYIEQDLVLSMDGTLYVSHDKKATRMTGDPRAFSKMTDEEIDALRTADGQPILRMTEVLARYETSVCYVTELKSGQELLDAFLSLVRQSGLPETQFIVQAWDPEVLRQLEEAFPDMPKLYLLEEQGRIAPVLEDDWVDIVAVSVPLMTAENCAAVHAAGKQFCVWTLNSVEEIKKAIDMGVDLYFTNFTAKALLLEERYRKEIHE